MFEQRDEADRAGMNPFERSDFTGVVTYDDEVTLEDGTKRKLKFGDVWEDGKRIENVYDYGEAEGNAILAQLQLDAKEQLHLFQDANGDQAKIRDALLSRANETTESAKAYRQQQAFVEEREQLEADWGAAAPIAIALGGGGLGAATGAGTGAAIGALGAGAGAAPGALIGGGIGFLLGAGGALLNQDELIDQFAEAQVKLNRANDLNNPVLSAGTAVQGYAAAVGSLAQPLTNVGVGLVEAANQDVGNSVGAREEEWGRDNFGLEALRFGLGFADAFAQFAGKPGAIIYQATMGAQAAGSVTQLATGLQWDDRMREFNPIMDADDPVENVGRLASAIGATGIDIVQTFTPTQVLRTADRLGRRAGGTTDAAFGLEKRIVDAANGGNKNAITAAKLLGIETDVTKTIGGRTFNMVDGKAVSVARVPNVTLLAPSEAVGWLSARAKALLSGTRGQAVSAEDLYAASLQMRELSTARSALLTGFAEGTEEVVQSILENWSEGYQPSFDELVRSALAGFAVGAGMAAGARVGRDPVMQGLDEVNAVNAMLFTPQITEAEWRAMSPVDRERKKTTNASLLAVARQRIQDLADDQVETEFNSYAFRQVAIDDALKALETARNNGLPAGERTWKLHPIGNPEVPSDVVQMELQGALEALGTQARVLEETGRTNAAAALNSLLAFSRVLLQRVLANPQLATTDTIDAPIPLDGNREIPAGTNSIEAVNILFEEAFNGNGIHAVPGQPRTWSDEEAREAVEVILNRSPTDSPGSWMLLRPMIDAVLTAHQEPGSPNRGWYVNHAVLKGPSADFDGDGAALRSFMTNDESGEARARLRLGLNILSEEGILIDSYAGELAHARTIIKYPKDGEQYDGILRILNDAVTEIVGLLAQANETSVAVLRQGVIDNLLVPLLEGHDPAAKQHFWKWLATTQLVEQAALNSGQRIPFRLNEIWTRAIFRAGNAIALEAGAVAPPTATPTTVTEIPASPASQLRAAPAATLFQSAELATTGNDDLRVKQKFAYSALTSQTLDAATTNDVTRWMQELYRVLSTGTTRTQAELATRSEEVLNLARENLQRIRSKWNTERAAAGQPELSLADLARVQVPNVTDNIDALVFYDSEPMTSVAQLVLRHATSIFRGRDAEVLSENDGELRKTYARLLNLDMKQAAKELFGPMLMEDLVGETLAGRMGWTAETLDSAIQSQVRKGRVARKQVIDRAKREAAYGDSASTELPASLDTVGEVTAFRFFMDVIETRANLFVTLDEKTGLASKNTEAGRNDAQAIDDLQASAREVRALLLRASEVMGQRRPELRRGSNQNLTPAQVQELLDLDPALARQIALVIPPEIGSRVFTGLDTGRLHVPLWFYEFLVEENSDLAAFKLWRGMLLAQMDLEANREGNGVSHNRLIALYQLLGVTDTTGASQARFRDQLATSTSIRQFLSFVNRHLNGDNVPQLAILTDQVAFDASFSQGGWRPAGSQSELRENIRAMREQIARSAELLDATLANEAKSEEFATKLLNGDAEARLLTQRAIDRARKLPTGAGPRTMINSLLSMAIGFVGSEADKAGAAKGTEGIGQAVMLEQASWGTPLAQLMAAWTSISEKDAFARPDRLLDPMQFWLRDGTPVEWPGLTVDLVTELYKDRAMRPMLMAALGPTAFDPSTEEGRSALQGLTDQSLHSIVADPADLRAILGSNSFSDLAKFVSLVNAKTDDDAALMLALKIFAARTSGATAPLNEADYRQWVDDAIESAGRILRALAQVPASRRADVRTLLKRLQPRPTLADPDDKSLTPMQRTVAGTIRNIINATFLDQLIGLSGPARVQKEEEQRRYRELLMGESAGQVLVAQYVIPDDPALVHDAKLRIWNEAKQRGYFWNFVQGPDADRARSFLATALGPTDPYPTSQNEEEDKKNWEALSRALIVYKLGAGTGQTTKSPEARATMAIDDPDFEMFLGDWSFLYSFASPANDDYHLWDAATELFTDLNDSIPPGAGVQNLVETIERELFKNEEYPLGPFSSTIIQQILNGKNRALQSSAPLAITMYGSNPENNITLATATRYTFASPDGQPTRTYTFNSGDLVSTDAKANPVPLTDADRERQRDFGGITDRLATLEGRFVKALQVLDPAGTPIDLFATAVKPTFLANAWPETRNSGYRVLSLGQLTTALKAAGYADLKLADLTISVEFFHPDDRPLGLEWANNIYFDGVAGVGGGQPGIGIIAADQQNAGQTQLGSRRALDALKKQKAALINPTLPSRTDVQVTENALNMAATIEYKTAQIMQTNQDATLISPRDRNRIRKQFLIQTVVRTVDLNDNVHVWSAEEIINWQKQNPGTLPDEGNLRDAQVLTIPFDFLATLLGEQGEAGIEFNMDSTQFSNRIQTWDNWTGTWDQELLRRHMPGLFQAEIPTPVEAIRNSLFAKGSFLRTSRPQRLASNRELRRYSAILDRWSQTQLEGGIQNRARIADQLREQVTRNYQTVLDAEYNSAQAPSLSTLALDQPEAAGLTSETRTHLQKALDAAQDLVEGSRALSISAPWTAWILELGGQRGPESGYMRSLDDMHWNAARLGQASGANPIPGDEVMIDPDQPLFRYTMVETLLNEGYRVRLYGPATSAARIVDVERELKDSGRFILRHGVWMLRDPRTSYQTALARESALLSVTRRSTRRMVGVFADVTLEGESAAFVRQPERLRGREVWIGKTLVHSAAIPGFQRPGTPKSVAAVNAYLDNFADPATSEAWLEHLAKLTVMSSGGSVNRVKEELRPFMERAVANTSRITGLPKTTAEDDTADVLKFGDFIFLVDNNNQVVIVRHGYRPFETEDNGNMLATQLAEPGPLGHRGGIAIYSNKVDDAPTFYEGRVASWDIASTGLVAQLRVPLSALSDKMIFTDDGIKIAANDLRNSGSDITDLQIAEDIPLSYIISYADHVSKEGEAIDNAATAITQLGFEPVEAYAKILLGTTQEEWDRAIAQRDTGRPEAFQDINSRVVDILDSYRNAWRSSTISPITAQANISALAGNYTQVPANIQALLTALPDQTREQLESQANVSVTPEYQVTLAALIYLGTPGAEVDRIMSTPGVRAANTIVSMPELFTNLFAEAPIGSPLNEWFFKRLNARLPFRETPDGPEGYYLRPDDFMMEIYTPGQPKREGLFSFKEAHSTGSDNGAIFGQAFETSSKQRASQTLRNMAILALYGMDAGHDPRLWSFEDYLAGSPNKLSTVEGLSAVFQGLNDRYVPPMTKAGLLTPAEVLHQQLGAYNVAAFSATFDMEGEERGWTDETRTEFNERVDRLFTRYGLRLDNRDVVHGWIRRWLWRPKERDAQPTQAEYGHVSFKAAMDALIAIETNLAAGRFPTWKADVPSMALDEVDMFIEAWQRSNGQGFIPDPMPWGQATGELARPKQFDPRTLDGPALREYFYEAALGEMLLSEFSSLNQNAVDGFMHTYQAAFDGGGTLPLSTDPLTRLQLLDPDFNNIVLSLDKNHRQFLKVLPLESEVDMRISDVFGGTLTQGRYARSYLGKDELVKAKARQKKWLADRRLADSYLSGQQINERGHVLRTNEATTNSLMRIFMNLRLANGMFHPWLFISAPMETGVRNTLENAVMLLEGRSSSALGLKLRTINDRIRAGKTGFSTVARTLSGNVEPSLSLDTLVHINDTVTSFAGNPTAISMIQSELYQDQPHMGGRFERWTERMVRAFGKMQDPSYGITQRAASQRVVGAVVKYFDAIGSENGRTLDDALTLLARNPQRFRAEHPIAYQTALNSLANARTIKATSFSLAARSFIDPLARHNSPFVNIPSNLFLKIPFAFQNYFFNVATNMLGLQALDGMLALALQGRTSGSSWGRVQAWLSGDSRSYDARTHGIDYLGATLESVNFADLFIRAGMTHTSLAALGMVLGGLAGGDDEDKKRRRREEMLGVGHVYDPRDFQNDWRNADAIYLDGIPGLEQMFRVVDPETGETHSPAELHWTLKQFISPIIGISNFANTGNFNHVFWGFEDAIGSMPLVSSMSWHDTEQTATMLFQKAMDAEEAAENGADETILAYATQFTLDAIARLERNLFENAFINSIYTAADKYDRDPWVLQDVDADGIIQRDNLDQPMETTALNEYLDSEGNAALGTAGRDDLFGQLRQYGERRATLAFFASLFTGFDSQNTLWRYNMAPREFSIDKQATSVEEATAFILSEWNGNNETLTIDGAEAFLKSIHAGYISDDSHVLDNIYLTFDQRLEVQRRLMTESYQDSFDLGLTTEEADKRWSDILWGSDDNPWATPLFDVIWSKNSHEGQIPYQENTTYRQLNTTWVIGPDGKPWATGISRGELYNFFGQAPLNAYSGSGAGDAIGNLGVDIRLNSVDEVGNVNTGQRSLEKVNATTANPTDEDILKAITQVGKDVADAIKGASYDRDGAGYYRYYGGGSGGSSDYANWTFMPFQNDMKNPYIDIVPAVYANEPNIRRSEVRRTRFSSERGRLNQWQ